MLQTLLTISSQTEGALELLKIEDWSSLTEIAVQYQNVLDIFNFTWVNASTISTEAPVVRQSIDKTIPTLLNVFEGTDAVTLLGFVGNFLPKITPEVRLQFILCNTTTLICFRLFLKTPNGLQIS